MTALPVVSLADRMATSMDRDHLVTALELANQTIAAQQNAMQDRETELQRQIASQNRTIAELKITTGNLRRDVTAATNTISKLIVANHQTADQLFAAAVKHPRVQFAFLYPEKVFVESHELDGPHQPEGGSLADTMGDRAYYALLRWCLGVALTGKIDEIEHEEVRRA